LEEVIAAVNANSSRVRTYAAHGATITTLGMPGAFALSGSILIERPDRFRIRAGTALTGPEIDMGANEQLLWMWMRLSDPPAVYVCRRDQFDGSQAQQLMPVDPEWLPSALGLVEFDPQGQHQGPRIGPDGNLEVISTIVGPSGPLTRIAVIDPTRAWILQQHVYDAKGGLVASALASQVRYFPEHRVSLPQRVELRVPPAQLALAIDAGHVYLNSVLGDPGQLWQPPQIQGHPQVDVGGGVAPLAAPTGARQHSLPPAGMPAITERSQADPTRVHPAPLPAQGWHPVYRVPLR
jgi:hypothetical protein